MVTGNTVATCATGAMSAADDMVHGTEDVEQGEPNKKESHSTHHWKKRKNMEVEKKEMRAKQMQQCNHGFHCHPSSAIRFMVELKSTVFHQ